MLFALTLMIFSISSCDKKIVGPTPHSYTFHIKVIDLNGENVLDNKDIYTLNKGITIEEADKFFDYKMSFQEKDGERYLSFQTGSPHNVVMEEVSYTIEENTFFIGSGPHEIRSVWTKEKNSVSLSRVFFDSRELKGDEGDLFFEINEPELD